MKKLLYIFLGLGFAFGCSDGPEIIPCVISEVSNDIVCIEIYEPVCGCNDVTYSNECYAELSGISSWIEGECFD
tara:strand:- start:106 stop:327 length:222 start_codon:yes stop_codon:yes gene_type:complete